ncbi:MAG: hypothetical protein K2L82_09375 [Lachnospiraceae bacterium]|nr:hypothetical protein [Lachnospiraceae bacterium]
MKKIVMLSAAFSLIAVLLAGCGESTPLLTAVDYELDIETNETNKGVSVGDTPENFLAAYGEYKIFTSVDGQDYQVLPTEEIPFDLAATTLLPTFFIDGLPVDTDAFCKENEIEKADLLNFLSSEDYLRSHTVVYYYLLFTWENGVITDIRSSYMDYNEDASYYKEFSN